MGQNMLGIIVYKKERGVFISQYAQKAFCWLLDEKCLIISTVQHNLSFVYWQFKSSWKSRCYILAPGLPLGRGKARKTTILLKVQVNISCHCLSCTTCLKGGLYSQTTETLQVVWTPLVGCSLAVTVHSECSFCFCLSIHETGSLFEQSLDIPRLWQSFGTRRCADKSPSLFIKLNHMEVSQRAQTPLMCVSTVY